MVDPIKAQELEQNVNQGVTEPTPEELQAAGVLDMSQFPVVAPDFNIDKFLSDFDPQSHGFDTLGCNIFSSIGMSEVNINSLNGGKSEFSERFSCVKAGLNGSTGSSEQQWENAVNQYGLVNQSDWPWTPGLTKEQYFEPIPDAIANKGLLFLQEYTPFHRTIGTDKASIIEALRYGAVKIFVGTGPGWNQAEPNVIPVNTGAMNHAVTVRKWDDIGIHIRDQYDPFLKVLHPDYKIFYAFQTLYRKIAFHHSFFKQLDYGVTNDEVVFVQMALQKDGEFPLNISFSQHFGTVTLQAVQQFQVKYGIAKPGDRGFGRVGPKTIVKLNQLFS